MGEFIFINTEKYPLHANSEKCFFPTFPPLLSDTLPCFGNGFAILSRVHLPFQDCFHSPVILTYFCNHKCWTKFMSNFDIPYSHTCHSLQILNNNHG